MSTRTMKQGLPVITMVFTLTVVWFPLSSMGASRLPDAGGRSAPPAPPSLPVSGVVSPIVAPQSSPHLVKAPPPRKKPFAAHDGEVRERESGLRATIREVAAEHTAQDALAQHKSEPAKSTTGLRQTLVEGTPTNLDGHAHDDGWLWRARENVWHIFNRR